MAKKQEKGEVEKDLDSIDNSLNATLKQYKVLDKKERKGLLKKLNKEEKRLSKSWLKEQKQDSNYYELLRVQSKINKIENQNDRINIEYGIFKFDIKVDYLKRIKNKEQYLDGLFHKKMKHVLGTLESPKTEGEAKQLEALVTQYSKKIKDTKFYNPEVIENSLNKLTNFRNKVNSYEYNDFVKDKRDRIFSEILNHKEEEIRKEVIKLEKKLKSKSKKITKKNKEEFKEEIKILKQDLIEIQNEVEEYEDSDIYEESEEYEEQIYKAIEEPIVIDGNLMGIRFNFF